MNNCKEKLLFFSMMILSVGVEIAYIYCKTNKWNLIDKMTVFFYPFFALFISFLVICTIISVFIYFIVKFRKTKKIYFGIPLLCIVFFHIVTFFFLNDQKLLKYNFNRYQADREYIVDLVLNHTLLPDEKGCIILPKDLNNEELARNGKVYIVKINSENGIYFCFFSGLLESSSGFLYMTDQKWNYCTQDNIILKEKYNENWYYCATD